VERQRTKYRYCNKLLYCLHGLLQALTTKPLYHVKDYIATIKHTPINRPSSTYKLVANLNEIPSNPVNLVGMNISSMYGGVIKPQYWEGTLGREMLNKRGELLEKSGVLVQGWDILESSCNEEEDKMEQRYDDDKMELMGAASLMDYSLMRMSQFG